jgi:hypothetical protein
MASYYCLVLRTAARHSAGVSQTILFFTLIATGLITWTMKQYAPNYLLQMPDATGWQIAAIVFVAIIIIRIVLAPYWIHIEQLKKLRLLEQTYDARKHTSLIDRALGGPKIEICFWAGQPYEVSEITNGRVLSTVKIGIKNSGGEPLSNCKVYIQDIAPLPPLAGGLPILLDGTGFTLRPDDPEKLIELAAHWNHVDKYRFSAPHGGFAETLNYLDDRVERAIVVKIISTEGQQSALFDIWTDEKKALHLEFRQYAN